MDTPVVVVVVVSKGVYGVICMVLKSGRMLSVHFSQTTLSGAMILPFKVDAGGGVTYVPRRLAVEIVLLENTNI